MAKISPQTRLLQDLGMDGDDAEEFLLTFAVVFQVDMAGFNFARHFRGEPHLFNLWSRNGVEALAPVTIGHLYRSALAGRLEDA